MIDLSKKYKTRRGGEVLSITPDGKTLHALEKFSCAVMHLRLCADGRYYEEGADCGYDLIEVRKGRRWTLTETGEAPRQLKSGEWGLIEGVPFLYENGGLPTLRMFHSLSCVESEVEL